VGQPGSPRIEDAPVPEYRIIQGRIHANLVGLTFTANDFALPTLGVEKKVRDRFEVLELRQSVAALAQLVAGDKKGHLTMPIPLEVSKFFSKALTPGTEIQSIWSAIEYGQIVQVLTQVRSRLLDFVLELSEKIEAETSDEEAKKVGRSPETGALFAHTVIGDNAVFQFGSNNVQSVSITVGVGDLEGLADLMKKHNMPAPDIKALKTAVTQDAGAPELAQKQFGPGVKEWVKTMWGKAVDTSWKVEVGIAGNLLTDGLKKFYGWD
jgi:hypothetical protein